MKTNINLDVLFPLNMENNIHEFEFFTKFGQPTENIDISIYVVPRYSIDEQKVRNIKTTYLLDRAIESDEIFGVLGILKELQNTVNDFSSSSEELGRKYHDAIHRYFHVFGVKQNILKN